MMSNDLTAIAFLALREQFFASDGNPVGFTLRPKETTQDDPFDEYVTQLLDDALPEGAECVKAPGPLITPDMVLVRVERCRTSSAEQLRTDLRAIVGLEVKKVERTKSGPVARRSGLDYNTTPPCGTIRVYQKTEGTLDIRGFYLFVCLESSSTDPGASVVTGLVLCDGNILNADFEYYLSVVGEREKIVGLGTYKDGADRRRPMVIFANPLGASELDHHANLIHPDPDLEEVFPQLHRIYTLRRNIPDGGHRDFYCYRLREDTPRDWEPELLVDPFPTPKRRETTTQARGRFELPFQLGL